MARATSPEHPQSIHAVDEKHDFVHDEIATDEEGKKKLDYSGAKTELSSEEVKLVKKLDLWIMV